jgi:hypothetical protein
VLDDTLLRIGLDALAVGVLAFALYDRRHGRRELAVVLALVNLAVLLALIVITAAEVGLSVGLGLFALLAMVRLRSETFSSTELAYVLVAIALALVNAIDVAGPAFALALDAVALGAVALLDHPRVSRPSQAVTVTLELVFADLDELRRHLEERLALDVLDVRLVEVDYVRETTRVELRCAQGSHGARREAGAVAVPALR